MTTLLEQFDRKALSEVGNELFEFVRELYPICRSITGDGIRKTLRIIGKRLPLEIHEVPSGTAVFDWTVPKEWNICDAYVKDPHGKRVVDFQKHNLHVLNYSVPINARLPLSELREHLFTLPEYPDWIPYRTSYYKEAWGFCMTYNAMQELRDGDYEVHIDSTLEDGSLTYGEFRIQGQSNDEVLISAHACHPSLANDNLSGIAVATVLAGALSQRNLRYSYRFLFAPGTIGAITWLARNQDAASRMRAGLVLTCIGDRGGFHYKKSRRGDAEIDRAMANVLQHCDESFEVVEFSPFGYDERQYCSPGFNLPVGCLMRSVWGTFPEYHTSADNLEFVTPKSLAGSLRVCLSLVDVLENNRSYRNLNPFCEPQLGKRNLYRSAGGANPSEEVNARIWVINLSDGDHSLLDIAERSGLPFPAVCSAAEVLLESGLLVKVPAQSTPR